MSPKDEDPTPPPPPLPSQPRPVLPYDSPARRGAELDWDGRPIVRRAFGSFAGNMAIGLAAFVASLVLGVTLGMKVRDAGPLIIFGPAGAVLTLGIIAACFPRYRGMLTGMLLVILIGLGIVLLIIGICTGIFK